MDKLFIKDLWGLVFEFVEEKVYTVPDWVLEEIKKQDDQKSIWSRFSFELDKLNCGELSSNPAAIHMLEQNLDNVDWYRVSSNPTAIHILEKNLDKVNWMQLSSNPAAIHILEQNLDKVDWRGLVWNPNIYVVDKKETRKLIKKKVDEFLE